MKVHYRSHKCPAPVHILRQIDSIHKPTSNFMKIHLNITLTSSPGSPKCSLSLRFSPPKPCFRLSSPPIRGTCPSHVILLDFITQTILGEQCRSLSSSLYNFLHSPVTSSLLGPNINFIYFLKKYCKSSSQMSAY